MLFLFILEMLNLAQAARVTKFYLHNQMIDTRKIKYTIQLRVKKA